MEEEELVKQYTNTKLAAHKALFIACFMLVYCLAQKMEAVCFSEMSVDFLTQLHISEIRVLHNHCCQNLELKSFCLVLICNLNVR
jgi:hypothetical protein